MATRRIGFVGYDGVTALDFFGPLEVFDTASGLAGSKGAYELLVLSARGEQFTTTQGVHVAAQHSFAKAPALDTIIVPGGPGIREPAQCEPIAQWLKDRAQDTRRIASVCIGIYALAQAGLLHNRRATTHWMFAADVAHCFPDIVLQPDSIFVRDGCLYSSAGVTAGIDLSLSLVEEDLGGATALAVARLLVVYMKRMGGQLQYSEPLQFQTRAAGRFEELATWILRNLRGDLSLDALADHVRLSPRQFSRRFKSTFGTPPGEYVERLRLDQARQRLLSSTQSIDTIAQSVGYESGDAFRRAFERGFGSTPSNYRRQFGPS